MSYVLACLMAISLMQPTIIMAASKKKVSKRKTLPAVSLITAQVDRTHKAKAKITLKWKRVKGAKSYQVSLRKTKTVKKKQKKGKKIKVKKVKKSYNKRLKTVKKTMYVTSQAYNKTYTFIIVACKGKLKSKSKIIKVKTGKYKAKKKDKKATAKKNTKTEPKNVEKVEEAASLPASLSLQVGDEAVLSLSKKVINLDWDVDQKGYLGLNDQQDGQNVTLKGVSSGTTTVTAYFGKEKRSCLVTVTEKYSYDLVPLLQPFGELFLLKTEDPDPFDLRFIDASSKYKTNEDPDIEISHYSYFDVDYIDEKMQKTAGGYIFAVDEGTTDGGELLMQRKVHKGISSSEYTADEFHKSHHYGAGISTSTSLGDETFMDTATKVTLPELQDQTDYLISQYTNDSMSFFDKMEAAQDALDGLAVYPRGVLNTSKPTGHYSCLAVSPYPEMSLNTHCGGNYRSYYQDGKYLMAQSLYPFVLDSLGFPGVLSSVAKRLDPNCTVSRGNAHFIINVTQNGETHTYGGAGSGSTNSMYDTHIQDRFTFDGSANDYYPKANLKSLRDLLFQYDAYADEDMKSDLDALEGETFRKAIGNGTWMKVNVESYLGGGGLAYAYELKDNNYTYAVSDAWIDGRYIGENEGFIKGATFADHPTSQIILLNQTYTNKNGKEITGPMRYTYSKDKDCWIDTIDYDGYYLSENTNELPDQFILTHDEVNKLGIDSNTNVLPEHGLIYDGSQPPGTPF